MRRDTRRRGNKNLVKDNSLIIGGVSLVLVFAVAIGIFAFGNKEDENKMMSNQIISLAPEDNTNESDTESASSSIGKSIEEEEKKENTNTNSDSKTTNTIDITNNVVSNNNTKDNSTKNVTSKNTTTKSTTTKNSAETNAEVKTESKKELTFIKPVEGELLKAFSVDNLLYSATLKEWVVHNGIDIRADKTSVVKATAEGTVKSIKNDPRYGLTVVIEHDDGYRSVYSNLLTAEFVVEGERVTQGQTVGTVGNTATFEIADDSHLHFELLKDSKYVDPTIYFK